MTPVIKYELYPFGEDIFCILTQDNVFLVNPDHIDDFNTMFCIQ